MAPFDYLGFLSNPITITTLAPLILLLVFIYVYYQQDSNGKKYHTVAGSVFHMFFNYEKLHDYMAENARKYKTFRMISPFDGMVHTSDPANVEYILKTNFQNYGKGPYTHEVVEELLGDGIFTVDGDKWREQRKLSSHEFATKVLRDYSSATFKNNTIKLGNILLEAANNNKIIDINDLFMKTTMDSIFNVGFGFNLDNMSGSSEEGIKFSRAFDDANTLTYLRFVDIFWKIKRYLNIGSEAELKKNITLIDEFVYKLIAIKTEEINKTKDENLIMKKDILSRFIQAKDKDPKFIRDVILNFVLAGKDPIGLSMTWFIYELCKHPEVQEKVVKEIEEAMNYPKEGIKSVADFAAYVTEDALQKMQYTHAALTETIRLYPALPSDPKMCFSDDVLPDGCSVKKGDIVFYMPYAMGRMKFIWGDDALEFKPERWLDEDGCFHPASPFKFTAFQAGLRACMGQDFAFRQMKILSSILLGCFEFKLGDENKVSTYRVSINLHVKDSLPVRVFSRFGLTNPQS